MAIYTPKVRAGFVYFVQAEVLRVIKIGIATNPVKRFQELKVGFPDRLHLLGLIESEDMRAAERSLHTHFRELRAQGEWFSPGDTLLRYIGENTILPDAMKKGLRPKRATERIRESILARIAAEQAEAA